MKNTRSFVFTDFSTLDFSTLEEDVEKRTAKADATSQGGPQSLKVNQSEALEMTKVADMSKTAEIAKAAKQRRAKQQSEQGPKSPTIRGRLAQHIARIAIRYPAHLMRALEDVDHDSHLRRAVAMPS